MVANVAKDYGVDERSRTFMPWSHVVSLVHAQVTHSIGLSDVCDSLQMHRNALATIRGATPPNRNTLSHANKVRRNAMAEALCRQVMDHLMAQTPGLAKGKAPVRRTGGAPGARGLVCSTHFGCPVLALPELLWW